MAQRFRDIITPTKSVRIRKIPELRKNFRGAGDSLTGVLSFRKLMAVKRAGRATLAVSIGIADNCDYSGSMFVFEKDKKR